MSSPLTLIANAMYDIMARRGIREAVATDSKRPRAWEEYGWPEEVTFEQLHRMYRRNGIARGGIDKIVGRCWSEPPYILEGTEADESRPETDWEIRTRKYAEALNLWGVFEDADRKRLVGGCSAILIEMPGRWHVKAPARGAVTGVRAIWRNQLQVKTRDTTTNQVTMWQYRSGEGSRTVDIHPDRVFLLGDWDDPESILEPIYNDLLDLDKVVGGVAEGTLKNASRQLSIEFGEGQNLTNLALNMGKRPEELPDVLNEMARDLNTGIDAVLALQGGKVVPIVASVPDAAAPAGVLVQRIAAGLGVPVKILVGNQTGERASTEDMRDFNATCQARCVKQLRPEVLRFFRRLDSLRMIEPLPAEVTVTGPDLTESTTAEKLTNAKMLADINKAGETSGPTFTAEEIRAAAGYEPLETTPGEDEETDDAPR